ncbi:MAG: glycosyltransferase family 2 protein [Cryobacterium sp.]|nr:glycosyltransferase family 2 protein [Cryobacterium sp.]
MTDPNVEAIIAVHTSTRPIARVVASIVNGTRVPVAVTVIAHNVERAAVVSGLGALSELPTVRVLELQDGIPSPAGPFNFGLACAEAEWVTLVGSDDELERGAIDSWLSTAEALHADFVIPRIHHVGGRDEATPPVRRGPPQTRLVEPVRDRLPYRSAPLGLMSMRAFGHLRFTERMRSGEDLAFVLQIWFSGRPIAFNRSGPAYLVHRDQNDRVSFDPRSAAEDFAILDDTIGSPWFARLTRRQRRLIVLKFLRMQVLDAVAIRLDRNVSEIDLAVLSKSVSRLHDSAPDAARYLAQVDWEVIEDLRCGRWEPESWRLLFDRRWNPRDPGASLPHRLALAAHPDSPARTLAAQSRVAQPPPSEAAAHAN